MQRQQKIVNIGILIWMLFSGVDCIGQSSVSDPINPERMGFLAKTIENAHGEVHYYLSTEGKPLDKTKKLPVVLFLEGSGPTPLFWGEKNRIGSSLMFDARDFPGFHFVVIGKPGVRFHETEQRITSDVYDKTLSLRWRVDAANVVVNKLAADEFVDAKMILVVGHSEGADVAPWIALENKHVTHVAGLAPGGVSQMFDFILFVRKKVAAGELSQAEGDQRIQEMKTVFEDIFSDPKSTTKKWQGESYLRWSTFFRPGNEAWCKLEMPVYLGICRDDKNTPSESGEAIQLEYTRLGKKNLTSKVWPCDHYFVAPSADNQAAPVDRRKDALQAILKWAKQQ